MRRWRVEYLNPAGHWQVLQGRYLTKRAGLRAALDVRQALGQQLGGVHVISRVTRITKDWQ